MQYTRIAKKLLVDLKNKRRDNQSRDTKNSEKLTLLGWDVMVVWECEISKDCSEKIDHIDFYDVKTLKPLISERGKIVPSRISF